MNINKGMHTFILVVLAMIIFTILIILFNNIANSAIPLATALTMFIAVYATKTVFKKGD